MYVLFTVNYCIEIALKTSNNPRPHRLRLTNMQLFSHVLTRACKITRNFKFLF